MRTYTCNLRQHAVLRQQPSCLVCGSEVGFCPACRQITALLPNERRRLYLRQRDCGVPLVAMCTTMPSTTSATAACRPRLPPRQPLCDCCRFNDTIPDLTVTGNLQKWYRLEAAKRRLFYDLGELGLPYGTAADGIEPPLAFRLQGRRRFPRRLSGAAVGGGEKVYTGHADGTHHDQHSRSRRRRTREAARRPGRSPSHADRPLSPRDRPLLLGHAGQRTPRGGLASPSSAITTSRPMPRRSRATTRMARRPIGSRTSSAPTPRCIPGKTLPKPGPPIST